MTIVALRGAPEFAAIVRLTLLEPAPAVGCAVIQSTKFCTVQLHVGPVVMPTLRCPPLDSTDTPVVLSENAHDTGVVVVLVPAIVDVGGGALVAPIVRLLNDSGLPLQSFNVRPPFQRRNCGSTAPPNSRSAVHSGVSLVRLPVKMPSSSVPMNSPSTRPVPPPGVT
jgi:hypothetical protein